MLEVSSEYAKAIAADVRDVYYLVSMSGAILDRTNIPKMRLTESMGDGKNLSVGVANCAELTFTINEPEIKDYNGMCMEPRAGIKLPSGQVEWIPLGVFWVTKTYTSNDFKSVNLTCADRMYYMTGEYWSELSYPAHVRDVVHEIAWQADVDFVEPEFWPDVYVRVKPEGLTYRNAFAYTAGLCGCNARFNRNGELEFTWYKDSGLTIERETQYLEGLKRTYDRPLSFTVAVTGEREKYSVNIVTEGSGYVTATPTRNVLEGENVMLTVRPYSGRELQSIKAVSEKGDVIPLFVADEGCAYSFIQPDCDVTVTAVFVATVEYPITCTTYLDGEIVDGMAVIRNADTDKTIDAAAEGDKVSITFTTPEGYVLGHFESEDVELTKESDNVYTFIMPAKEVAIAAYLASEGEVGKYSWLSAPAIPPTEKPYWAVFYKNSPKDPICMDFHLVWFDSWTVPKKYDTTPLKYKISFEGYYHCGSSDVGHGAHAWDTSAWEGNGTAGDTIEWNSFIGYQWDGDDPGYIYNKDYCLLASNVDLLYNSRTLFNKNPDAIQAQQVSYIVDGQDVRQAGSLGYFKCPDTVSTPAPAANWMIVDAVKSVTMKPNPNVEGAYMADDSREGLYVVFFDSISIVNRGTPCTYTGENLYHATVTNGHYCKLVEKTDSWGTLYDVNDGSIIGLRDPLFTQTGAVVSSYYARVLATSVSLTNGALLVYKNSCKICDCVSPDAVSTFSLRSSAPVDVKPVKLNYTNPLIYEKMVPAVSSSMQDIVFTPAKLKHRGNPALQAGDIVRAPDRDGVYHNILIMQQVMNFGGGMNSDITCYGQDEDAISNSSYSPMRKQIKEEVSASCSEMEHGMSQNQSETLAAIYQSITNVKRDDNQRFEKVEKNIGTINETLTDLKPRVESLEDRVTAIENDSELGNLKRELAATDQHIAHCAEIFMLEVMVSGKTVADVVLPYDISELHTTREALRAQIAELEVQNE